jgi:hypothetical protein
MKVLVIIVMHFILAETMIFPRPQIPTHRLVVQCCQLADISAAKHISGPIKISAAGKIAYLYKNGRKGAELFEVCSSYKNLDYLQKLTRQSTDVLYLFC